MVAQVDGRRWLSLEGPAEVTDDPARVAEAVRLYAERYRQPGERPDRVAIEIRVDRILGSRCGYFCVKALVDGRYNMVVGQLLGELGIHEEVFVVDYDPQA